MENLKNFNRGRPPKRVSLQYSEDSDSTFDENIDFRGRKRVINKGKYLKKPSDIAAKLIPTPDEKVTYFSPSSSNGRLSTSSIENLSFPKRRRVITKNKYLKQPLDVNSIANAIAAKESSVDLTSEDESSIHRLGPRVPRKRSLINKVELKEFVKGIDTRDVSNTTESESDEKDSSHSAIYEALGTDLVLNNNVNRRAGIGRVRLHNREIIPMQLSDFAANIERLGNERKERGDISFGSSSFSSFANVTPRRHLHASGDASRQTSSSKDINYEDMVAKNREKISTEISFLNSDNSSPFSAKVDENQEKTLTEKSFLNFDNSSLSVKDDAVAKLVRVANVFPAVELRVVVERLSKSDVTSYTKEDPSIVSKDPKRTSFLKEDGSKMFDVVSISPEVTNSEDGSRDLVMGTATLMQVYNSKLFSSSHSTSSTSDPDETEIFPLNKSQHKSAIVNRSLTPIYDTTPVKRSPNFSLRKSSIGSAQNSLSHAKKTINFISELNEDESPSKKSLRSSKKMPSYEYTTPHVSDFESNKRYSFRNESEKVPEMSINKRPSSDKQILARKSSNRLSSGVEMEEILQTPTNKSKTSVEQTFLSKSNTRYSTRSDDENYSETSTDKSETSDRQISPSKSSKRSTRRESETDPGTSFPRDITFGRLSSNIESNKRFFTGSQGEIDSEMQLKKSKTLISPSKSNKLYSTGSEKESIAKTKRLSLSLDSNKRYSSRNEIENTTKSPIKKAHSLDEQILTSKSNKRYSTRSEGVVEPVTPIKPKSTGGQNLGSKSRSKFSMEIEDDEYSEKLINQSRTSTRQISPSNSSSRFPIRSEGENKAYSKSQIPDTHNSISKSISRYSTRSQSEDTPIKKKQSTSEQILGLKSRNKFSLGIEDEESPKKSSSKNRTSEEQNSDSKLNNIYSTRSQSEESPIKKNQSTGGLISGSKSRNEFSLGIEESPEKSISKNRKTEGESSASKLNNRYSTRSQGEESPIKKNQSISGQNLGAKPGSRFSIGNEWEESPEKSISKSRTSSKQVLLSKPSNRYSNGSEKALETPIKKKQSSGSQNWGSKSRSKFSAANENETDQSDSASTSFDLENNTERSKGKMNTSLNWIAHKLLKNISPIKKVNTPRSSVKTPDSKLSGSVIFDALVQTSTAIKNSSRIGENVSRKRSPSNSLKPEAKKPRLVQSTIDFQSKSTPLVIPSNVSNSQNKGKANKNIDKSSTNKPSKASTSNKDPKNKATKKRSAGKRNVGYAIPRRFVKYNAERFTLRRLSAETVGAVHKASEKFLKDTVKNLENKMRLEGKICFTHRDLLKYFITIGLFKDKSHWIQWVREQAPWDYRVALIPCARAGNVVY